MWGCECECADRCIHIHILNAVVHMRLYAEKNGMQSV